MKPSERQRTLTGAMCWAPDQPTEPGRLDGEPILLVVGGRPNPKYPQLRMKALALIAAANAHPPAEEKMPVLSTGAAVREQRARRRG